MYNVHCTLYIQCTLYIVHRLRCTTQELSMHCASLHGTISNLEDSTVVIFFLFAQFVTSRFTKIKILFPES